MGNKTNLKLDDFNSFLEKLAENSDSVYWLSSADFKSIVYVSPAYEKIWGRSREELYLDPKMWILYLHPQDARDYHPIYEMADRIAKEGDEARFTENYRIVRPDGEIRWILDRGFPLYDTDGLCLGVTGVAIDITKEKKYEDALREANEAKSAFIANMSHDVKGPIASNIGLSKLVESEEDINKTQKYGQLIRESNEQLLELTNDILDIVEIEQLNENQLKFVNFNIRKQIDNLKKLLQSHAVSKNLDIFVEVDALFPEYIYTDRIKLYRILLNLVNNAIKFTESGWVRIKIELKEYHKKNHLLITVSDTGIGISEDKLDKIFDRFFRIVPSYTNKYSGYGIGLFIVKKYVDLLEGSITVVSEVGKGTQFEVTIPVLIEQKEDAVEDALLDSAQVLRGINVNPSCPLAFLENPVQSHSSSCSQRKVLIIEDDSIARHIVRVAFKKVNFEVDTVETAEAGFSKILINHYDLVVTDIGLPGMDGNQFSILTRLWEKMIKYQEPIPIVGLTAHGMTQKEKSISAGIDLLISKPINDEKIDQILSSLFTKIELNIDASASSTSSSLALGIDLPYTEEELFQIDSHVLLDEQLGIETLGDIDILVELLIILVDVNIPEEIENLQAAYRKQDWPMVQAIAHKLKGSALYCGTIKMQYACQYMERYLLAGHSKLAEQLYQQLIQVLTDTAKAIREWLDNRVGSLA